MRFCKISHHIVRPIQLQKLCKMFATVLLDIDQCQDGVRPLTDDEVKIFDCSRQSLVALIYLGDLVDTLQQEGCITDQQKDRIMDQPITNDRIRELLDTIRRGSYESLVVFIRSLENTEQGHVADFLRNGGGSFRCYQLE